MTGLAGCYVSTIGKPHEYFDLTGGSITITGGRASPDWPSFSRPTMRSLSNTLLRRWPGGDSVQNFHPGMSSQDLPLIAVCPSIRDFFFADHKECSGNMPALVALSCPGPS